MDRGCHRAHAGVEPGHEHDALRVHRSRNLVRCVGTEPAAARAVAARRLGHVEVRDAHRPPLVGDVDDIRLLPRLATLVAGGLVYDHDQVAMLRAGLRAPVLSEALHLHAQHRQRGMRAHVERRIDARHLGSEQVGRRRLLRPGEELLAVDNLERRRFSPCRSPDRAGCP